MRAESGERGSEILFDRREIPGYARFRIPGIVTCADGTVLAYCEARQSDDDWAVIDILLRNSDDGGRSFSAPVVLASGTKEGKTVNNPVMIAGKDGTVHFLYCVEYGLKEAGGGVFYRRSSDSGLTWSEPREITAMTAPERRNVFATGPGHGIELADGTLLVPCWTVLKEHGVDLHSHHPGAVCCLKSGDGGDTWGISAFVPNGEVDDPNETAAAQLPDGTVVLSVRDGASRCRCGSVSRDGVTFSPIRQLPDVPDPICCAGMVAVDRKLYLTNCNSRTERGNLTLWESSNGTDWNPVQTIDAGSAGYSDLTEAENSLVITYEKENAIVCTMVPLE